MAQIRYIKYDYLRENDEWVNRIYYSFTNYEDCDSEEEFLETIQSWSSNDPYVVRATDFSMFTGITRVDTDNSVGLSDITFSKEAHISYVVDLRIFHLCQRSLTLESAACEKMRSRIFHHCGHARS